MEKLGGEQSNHYKLFLEGAELCYDSDIKIPELVQGETLVIGETPHEVMQEYRRGECIKNSLKKLRCTMKCYHFCNKYAYKNNGANCNDMYIGKIYCFRKVKICSTV